MRSAQAIHAENTRGIATAKAASSIVAMQYAVGPLLPPLGDQAQARRQADGDRATRTGASRGGDGAARRLPRR